MVHGNRLTCTIKFQFWYRFLFRLQQVAVGAWLRFDSFRCFLLLNFLCEWVNVVLIGGDHL
jgi:hypothetical protein